MIKLKIIIEENKVKLQLLFSVQQFSQQFDKKIFLQLNTIKLQRVKQTIMISVSARKFKSLTEVWPNSKYFMATKNRKVQEVGFKTQDIIDTNQLTFIVKDKLVFQNGRALVYRSKKGFITSFKRYIFHYSSIFIAGSLIYFNPFEAVLPAAIPVLWVFELIMIQLTFKRYIWNKSTVHEIYVNQSGSTTQIHFADKTRRRLFGEPQQQTYYNTIFADPIQREKNQVMPNLNPLPQTSTEFEKKQYSGGFWCKYFSNGQNYLLIPRQFEFLNKQVLVISHFNFSYSFSRVKLQKIHEML